MTQIPKKETKPSVLPNPGPEKRYVDWMTQIQKTQFSGRQIESKTLVEKL